MPDSPGGEALAVDVLVEPLPGADPEGEPPVEMMARVAAAWAMMAGW